MRERGECEQLPCHSLAARCAPVLCGGPPCPGVFLISYGLALVTASQSDDVRVLLDARAHLKLLAATKAPSLRLCVMMARMDAGRGQFVTVCANWPGCNFGLHLLQFCVCARLCVCA